MLARSQAESRAKGHLIDQGWPTHGICAASCMGSLCIRHVAGWGRSSSRAGNRNKNNRAGREQKAEQQSKQGKETGVALGVDTRPTSCHAYPKSVIPHCYNYITFHK